MTTTDAKEDDDLTRQVRPSGEDLSELPEIATPMADTAQSSAPTGDDLTRTMRKVSSGRTSIICSWWLWFRSIARALI